MGRNDEYATITAMLKARTEKAVLLENDGGDGGWIPRSCLHFTSDQAVRNAALGDELELRVMEWAAEDKGLL